MRPLIIVIVCLGALQGFSQQMNLSIGPAFPVGAFGSKDGNDPASGLARLGALAELSYRHALGKTHFGLVGMVRGRLNPISKDGAVAPLKAQFSSYQWTVSRSSWKAAAVMAGVYYMTPINEKWSFMGELAAGASKAYLPEMTVRGIQDSTAQGGYANLVQAENKKADATTFTAMARVGVVYRLTERWSLTACLDYWRLKANFTVTQNVGYGQHMVVPGYYQLSNAAVVSYYSTTGKYSQQMNSLNLMVGVSMRL